MENILKIAQKNQKRAFEIIEELNIVDVWHSVGAEAHPVGSLKTGLLMKHRDIDFHIYSDPPEISKSFRAMSIIAKNPAIKRIEFANLIDTDERCLEWHAWYLDRDNELWQLDLIHILKGSFYDGYFERVAERISAVLTPETRDAILRIKYDTPDTEKVFGIEYYQAVIRDGVRNYSEFEEWRKLNSKGGIVDWMP